MTSSPKSAEQTDRPTSSREPSTYGPISASRCWAGNTSTSLPRPASRSRPPQRCSSPSTRPLATRCRDRYNYGLTTPIDPDIAVIFGQVEMDLGVAFQLHDDVLGLFGG